MNNRPSPNKTRQIGFLVLIFVLLLGTIYSMTRNTAKESLVYSEVIELFETKQVESFTIDTDGNLTMQLRSAYKGQTKYSYECGSFSIFYNDLNDLVQEQKAEGILTEYDYPPAWEAAWWPYPPARWPWRPSRRPWTRRGTPSGGRQLFNPSSRN